MTWDTLVIGSGPGGLTAAVALARAGHRVLVLEQHYLPGGWTHSFTLDGFRFSPGVHYVGDLGPEGGLRRLYEGLGISRELEFCELSPDGFDHYLIAGDRIDQPRGRDRWLDRLCARFPDEQAGIRRYVGTLASVASDLVRCDELLEFPSVLALPLRAPALTRWGLRTLAPLLDDCVKSPALKAVLSAACGNHGLAPSRVSLPVHAAMTAHYWEGGFYPRGGGRSIARAYIRELRRHRGEIRLRSRVARILVDGGRARGVELAGGERIEATNVVCNADPAVTYGKLLPAPYCRREMRKVARTEYSVGLLSVFCAVDMDLRAAGYDSGNYWWYRTTDIDGLYRDMERRLPEDEIDGLFLTITTLKDPAHVASDRHTIEMFAFVPFEPFAQWAGPTDEHHDARYQALKNDLGQRVLAAAENVIPGLRDKIRFVSFGTPLTDDFYCETYRGSVYGAAKTPWQVGPFAFRARGPVGGLHLCGASILSHGVAGASFSGLMAAKNVLGLSRADALLESAGAPIRIYPADRPEEWLEAKARAARRGPRGLASAPPSSQ